MTNDWLMRTTAALPQTRVHRLGLAGNYGLDEAGARAAVERGVNLFFLAGRAPGLRAAIAPLLATRRETCAVVAYSGIGPFSSTVRMGVERQLKKLGTDYLDVVLLGWIGVTSFWTAAMERELVHLRESGKVRAIGVSIHNRPKAGRLAADSPLDLLMLRYNAAHPGAEQDVFPRRRGSAPTILAYTATSWRKLLKAPNGWTGPTMTAGDCYRFQLSSPHVDLALMAPRSAAELVQNLDALEKGPLGPDELAWMREYGRRVHG